MPWIQELKKSRKPGNNLIKKFWPLWHACCAIPIHFFQQLLSRQVIWSRIPFRKFWMEKTAKPANGTDGMNKSSNSLCKVTKCNKNDACYLHITSLSYQMCSDIHWRLPMIWHSLDDSHWDNFEECISAGIQRVSSSN